MALFIYASNEPKSVLARDLGDCRDNYEKLAERVSHSLREQRAKVCAWKYNLPTSCQLCYNVMYYAIYIAV